MKTRLWIMVVIPVAVFLIGAIVYPYINKTTFDNDYSHDIKTALDYRDDLKDVVDVDVLPGSANPEQQENLFPKTIHVVIGINNTIRWNNLDSTPHTFSPNSESNGFPDTIGVLRPNESQEITFEIPGVYDYHGVPGPWITGTVIVSDETFDGPGNRHPAFLGFDIPEVCTDDMIKHLDRYSSMFDRNVPYTLEWISIDDSINADDFDMCVKELLEKNPRNIRNENRTIIEGQMAEQICSITGGQCPPYYIGNPQEDGSVMVVMTFSDGTQERQIMFFIKNGTLSYEKHLVEQPKPPTQPETTPEIQPTDTGLHVDITGQQQVRRGTTHDIMVDVTRNGNPVHDALVRITIEDYGKDIIREFKGKTDSSGKFVFSWEIPKSFDDIETLLAYVDVTDDISAKTVLFKFQVYCLPNEKGCKVEGN